VQRREELIIHERDGLASYRQRPVSGGIASNYGGEVAQLVKICDRNLNSLLLEAQAPSAFPAALARRKLRADCHLMRKILKVDFRKSASSRATGSTNNWVTRGS